jgi:hypothetical protein
MGALGAKQQVDCGRPPVDVLSSGGPTSGTHDVAVEPGNWRHGVVQPFGSSSVKQIGAPVG